MALNADSLNAPNDDCSPERRRFDQKIAKILNSWLRRERTYLLSINEYALIADEADGLTVQEYLPGVVVVNARTLQFSTADGFGVAQISAGVARVSLTGTTPAPITTGNVGPAGGGSTADETTGTLYAANNTGVQISTLSSGVRTVEGLAATPSQWGVVTTSAQSLGGDKNFTDDVTVDLTLTVDGTIASNDHYICNSKDGLSETAPVGYLPTFEGGIYIGSTTAMPTQWRLQTEYSGVSHNTAWTGMPGLGDISPGTQNPIHINATFFLELYLGPTGDTTSCVLEMRMLENNGGGNAVITGSLRRVGYTLPELYCHTQVCYAFVWEPASSSSTFTIEYKYGGFGTNSGSYANTDAWTISAHEIR